MDREGGYKERMRNWRKNFLIKIGHILSQNVKYGIFVADVTKTEHTRYEEIILGRILCEEAPQVVTAWTITRLWSTIDIAFQSFTLHFANIVNIQIQSLIQGLPFRKVCVLKLM